MFRTTPNSLREFLVLQRTFLLVYTNDCDVLCLLIVATFQRVSLKKLLAQKAPVSSHADAAERIQ